MNQEDNTEFSFCLDRKVQGGFGVISIFSLDDSISINLIHFFSNGRWYAHRLVYHVEDRYLRRILFGEFKFKSSLFEVKLLDILISSDFDYLAEFYKNIYLENKIIKAHRVSQH